MTLNLRPTIVVSCNKNTLVTQRVTEENTIKLDLEFSRYLSSFEYGRLKLVRDLLSLTKKTGQYIIPIYMLEDGVESMDDLDGRDKYTIGNTQFLKVKKSMFCNTLFRVYRNKPLIESKIDINKEALLAIDKIFADLNGGSFCDPEYVEGIRQAKMYIPIRSLVIIADILYQISRDEHTGIDSGDLIKILTQIIYSDVMSIRDVRLIKNHRFPKGYENVLSVTKNKKDRRKAYISLGEDAVKVINSWRNMASILISGKINAKQFPPIERADES